jgi:hypothetical protein
MSAQFCAITLGNRTAGEELFSLEKLPFVDLFLIIETMPLPKQAKHHQSLSSQGFYRL